MTSTIFASEISPIINQENIVSEIGIYWRQQYSKINLFFIVICTCNVLKLPLILDKLSRNFEMSYEKGLQRLNFLLKKSKYLDKGLLASGRKQ